MKSLYKFQTHEELVNNFPKDDFNVVLCEDIPEVHYRYVPYDKEIAWLESPGNCGNIITDFIPTGQDIRMVGKFNLKAYKNSTAWTGLFAAYTGENYNTYRIIRNNTTTNQLAMYNGQKANGGATMISFSLGTIYTFDFNRLSYNFGGSTGSLKANYTGTENNKPFTLIGLHNITFYYFKIYKADILRLDLIPVKLNNVGYMYDKVSGKLFGNAGSGTYTLGPDID